MFMFSTLTGNSFAEVVKEASNYLEEFAIFTSLLVQLRWLVGGWQLW